MRLLLIEDDTTLNQELSQQLRKYGFAVDSEKSGVDGAFMGETEPYDVIILDLGLPDLPGLDVLSQWRNKHIATPVLILTARGDRALTSLNSTICRHQQYKHNDWRIITR